MAAGSASVEGGPELVAALRELGKTAGKNTLRRVGRARLKPMHEAAVGGVPERTGSLRKSVIIGTRLAPSQRQARGIHVGGGSFRTAAKDRVQVHMGPGQHPQAIQTEFGNFKDPAQPWMRPAWDAEKENVVPGIGKDLWGEIEKTAARAAKKAARIKAKGL